MNGKNPFCRKRVSEFGRIVKAPAGNRTEIRNVEPDISVGFRLVSAFTKYGEQ